MQAGATGTNTLRVYNPIKQAEDNDPDGAFCRPLGARTSATAARVARQALDTAGKPAKAVQLPARRKLSHTQRF